MVSDVSDADFDEFLRRSALAAQSIEALCECYPRWRTFLESKGVTVVPSPLSQRPEDAAAINYMNLLIRQASEVRDSASEHHLRNMTKVRPFKP